MAETTVQKATRKEYEALPEGPPYQLIDGQLIMSPSPTRYHQIAAGEIEYALRRFVKENDVPGRVYDAPLDTYLEDTEAYQPDVVFVSHERSNIEAERLEGAPDLVVEVLSPSTGYYDLTHKKEVYARHGVREYWLVDPQRRQVDVLGNQDGRFEPFSHARDEGTVRSEILDGFEIALAGVFAW